MKKKLTLQKLVISKLNNPHNIIGGNTAVCDTVDVDCQISGLIEGCPPPISAIIECTESFVG